MVWIDVQAGTFSNLIFVDHVTHLHILQFERRIVAQRKRPITIWSFRDTP